MFIKTKRRFEFILFFFAIFLYLICGSGPICALEFDFTKRIEESCVRKDENLSSKNGNYSRGASSYIIGHIVYRESPFYFSFETFEPERNFWCIDSTAENFSTSGNSSAAGSNKLNFQETANLLQTCNDFLLWFKDDFGLGQSGFVLENYEIENEKNQNDSDNIVIANYSLNSMDEKSSTNINKARIKFSKTILANEIDFYNSDGNVAVKSQIEDFYFLEGNFYPCKILMTNYEYKTSQNIQTTKTEIVFSNLKIAANEALKVRLDSTAYSTTSYKDDIPRESTDNSKLADSSYSVPAVTAQAGFFLYKKFITNQDASSCRYEPTCSKFMLEAIKQNGLFGIIQGIDRLERCTREEHSRGLYPENEQGKHIDPVPAKTNVKKTKKNDSSVKTDNSNKDSQS